MAQPPSVAVFHNPGHREQAMFQCCLTWLGSSRHKLSVRIFHSLEFELQQCLKHDVQNLKLTLIMRLRLALWDNLWQIPMLGGKKNPSTKLLEFISSTNTSLQLRECKVCHPKICLFGYCFKLVTYKKWTPQEKPLAFPLTAWREFRQRTCFQEASSYRYLW